MLGLTPLCDGTIDSLGETFECGGGGCGTTLFIFGVCGVCGRGDDVNTRGLFAPRPCSECAA